MQLTKIEHDGDISISDVCITDYPTTQNRNQLNCGVCNGAFYADDETFQGISRVIEQGLDNPFMCDSCREEYEELAIQR